MNSRKLTAVFLLLIACLSANTKIYVSKNKDLSVNPENYTIRYTSEKLAIDGDLSDSMWKRAAWTSLFQDIEGSKKPKPRFKTRVKMLWSDSCLLIAAEMEEPHVWAKLKKHDEIVFHDNDFEVFIDPDNDGLQYFEIEVNAFNTIFDLFLTKAYREGGKADHDWNAKGLRSAVKVNGSINNPKDKDKGWSVEMAIPYSALTLKNKKYIPAEGSLWRTNFSRVEWEVDAEKGSYEKKKDRNGKLLPENNWVWSPQGVVNMHYPEKWGYLRFTKK